MSTDNELLIAVRADIAQAKAELGALVREVRSTANAAKTSAENLSAMGRSVTFLKRGAQSYVSLQLAKDLILAADAYNVLQQRIHSATRETGDYYEVSRQLERVSNANGVALRDTVDLFQRISFSAKALGASNRDILTLTDTVQKLGVIGGSTQGQLSAGLLQFSQALASGTVHAEEMNSIIENIPLLANKLESALGVVPGQLRNAVIQGKVLSHDVFEALLRIAPEVSTEFDAIPQSLERSSQSLLNVAGKFVAKLDNALGISKTLIAVFQAADNAIDHFSQTKVQRLRAEIAAVERDLKTASDPYRIKVMTDELAQARAALRTELGKGSDATALRIQLEDLDKQIASTQAEFERTLTSDSAGKLTALEGRRDRLAADLAKLEAEEQAKANAPPPVPPPAPPSPELERQRKVNEAAVRQLELEATTYGKTAGEVTLYKLALDGATKAQLDRAKAAVASTQADRDFEDAVRASEEAVKAENEAYQQWLSDLKTEGKQVYEETRTAQERLAEGVEHLNLLLKAGVIDQDTYARRLKQLQQDGSETFNTLEAAARGWGDDFTNQLADMVLKGKGDFHDLADSIIRDLLRIAFQKNFTDKILAAGATLFTFAGGGPVMGAGTATSDSIPARLSNGEYVIRAAAVRTYGAPFMEAINRLMFPRFPAAPTITAPSYGFASGGLASGSGQPTDMPIEINIDNRGSPVSSSSARSRIEPDKLVIDILLEDARNGGPYHSHLQSLFGLRRGAR